MELKHYPVSQFQSIIKFPFTIKQNYYAIDRLPPALEIFAISSLNLAIVSFAKVNFSLRSITSSLILLRASMIAFIVDSFFASTVRCNSYYIIIRLTYMNIFLCAYSPYYAAKHQVLPLCWYLANAASTLLDLERLFLHKTRILNFSCLIVIRVLIGTTLICDILLPEISFFSLTKYKIT